MPSDPFEVDLLTMAEAVTTAHSEVPDCIIEPDEVKRTHVYENSIFCFLSSLL